MTISPGLATTPLARLGALAVHCASSPEESIREALDVACALTGHATALLAERSGGAWVVDALCGESFGFAPGDPIALDELAPADRIDGAPVVIAEGGDKPAALPARIGATSITPLPASADLDAAVLCTLGRHSATLEPHVVDALRILARFIADERAPRRQRPARRTWRPVARRL